MKTKRSPRLPYPVPPLAGGQDVDEVLQTISTQLKGLAEREQRGEDVSTERQTLEAAKAEAEAAKSAPGGGVAAPSGGQPSYDELLAFKQQADLKTVGEQVAEVLAGQVKAAQAQQGQALGAVVQEALTKHLGGAGNENPFVQAAVESVMAQIKGQRAPSRFANEHATEQHLDQLAAGFTADGSMQIRDPQTLKAGAAVEAKAIMESKSLQKFMGAVMRFKQGLASDGEREFLLAQHRKALAEGTGSAGGFLVPEEWMGDILGLLRAQAVVRRAQPRFQPFARLMQQTSISSGATAYYTAENARITPSEPTFAEAPLLTPKNLTGMVPVSTYLLWDSGDAEDTVRADLAEVMGLREDLAFLQGTGTGGEPLGLKNQVGVTSNVVAPGANGVNISYIDLRRIRARLRSQNAGAVRPVWFFHPDYLTYLETAQEMSGGSPTGRALLDANILRINDDMTSGVIDGVPFFTTTQIPNNITLGTGTTTYLLLVNMAETIVGINREMEITTSDEASYTPDGGTTWISAFQNNQTLFKAVMRHDIAHRRPAQIIVQSGVLFA